MTGESEKPRKRKRKKTEGKESEKSIKNKEKTIKKTKKRREKASTSQDYINVELKTAARPRDRNKPALKVQSVLYTAVCWRIYFSFFSFFSIYFLKISFDFSAFILFPFFNYYYLVPFLFII